MDQSTKLLRVLVCVVLISFGVAAQKTVGDIKKVTIFDHVCTEEDLYTPYIKYYRGRVSARRTGKTLKTVYPGVYVGFDDPDYQNAYMCINGFAWLYLTIKENTAKIYDTTELHAFVHTCVLINGLSIIVPDPEDAPPDPLKTKTLKGIFLMGQKNDYRLPDIHTFTAPYTDAAATPPGVFNATSLVIIGSATECLLERGESSKTSNVTSVRIRSKVPDAPPAPPPAGEVAKILGFCTLQFKNIETQVETSETGKLFLPDFFSHKKPSGVRHDMVIRKNRCVSNPKIHIENAAEYIDEKIKNVTDRAKELAGVFVELVEHYKDTLVGTSDNTPDWTADPCATPADCTPAKILEEAEPHRKAYLGEKDKTSQPAKDAKKLLMGVLLKPCVSNVFRIHKEMKELMDAAGKSSPVALWGEVKNVAETTYKPALEKQVTDLTTYKDKLDAWEKANKPTDPADTTFTEYQAALEALKLTNATVDTAALKLSQAVAGAESAEASMESLIKPITKKLTKFQKQFEGLEKALTDPKCVHESVVENLAGSTVAAGIIVDMDKLATVKMETHPSKFDEDIATLTCGSFPTVKEACDNAKPKKEVVAALLRARINSFKDFTATPPTDVEFADEQKWRLEIFTEFESVYHVACGAVMSPQYVIGVNRIIKGYLMNFVPDVVKGDLPKKSGGWKRIRPILKQCAMIRDAPRFNFTYIQNARNSDRFFVEIPNKDGVWIEEIFQNREQVELEYSLNWAIDSFWKIFSTVLGFCMVPLETTFEGVSNNFHKLFEDDFIAPLKEEWRSPRHNLILGHLMGEYYETRQDDWATMCMEGIFLLPDPHSSGKANSDDEDTTRIKYRPVRKLPVNRETEPNYIYDDGPLQWSVGMYSF